MRRDSAVIVDNTKVQVTMKVRREDNLQTKRGSIAATRRPIFTGAGTISQERAQYFRKREVRDVERFEAKIKLSTSIDEGLLSEEVNISVAIN